MMNGCDEMILAIIFIGRLRTLLAHFVSGFLVDVMIRPGRAVIWRGASFVKIQLKVFNDFTISRKRINHKK